MHGELEWLVTRGVSQGMLLLHNGVSLFDPMLNVAAVGRQVPLESIKRVEVVTGPGGVLWGANSFVGVINIVTKDADDVEGVQGGIGFGDGHGDQMVYRAYAMAGRPSCSRPRPSCSPTPASSRYLGPKLTMPGHLLSPTTPQPNGPVLFGAMDSSNTARSTIINFDGKFTYGDLSLYWSVPWAKRYFGTPPARW